MIKKYWPIGLFALAMPLMPVLAEDGVQKFLTAVKGWVDTLIPILVGLALIYFIWSTIKLITTDNSEKREEAKKGMFWGIIALFVIVSIWGITTWVGDIFSIQKDATIKVPQVPDN